MLKKILFGLMGLISVCTALAKSTAPQWPEGVTPSDTYPVVAEMNAYADELLKHKKIKFKPAPPTLETDMTPTVVFQLHLSIIQLLHHYELSLGLRPVPIVTSSPIKYYPADVKFLSKLIVSRMQRIDKHMHLKFLPKQIPTSEKKVKPSQIYDETLAFYLKLLLLSGHEKISVDQLFNQINRIQYELRNIVLYQLDLMDNRYKKRALAASLYGVAPYSGQRVQSTKAAVSMTEIYKKLLSLRASLKPLLEQQKVKSIPIPKGAEAIKPTTVDIFTQSQIILADLTEWKDISEVGVSTPITALATGKTIEALYDRVLQIEFIVDRLRAVFDVD